MGLLMTYGSFDEPLPLAKYAPAVCPSRVLFVTLFVFENQEKVNAEVAVPAANITEPRMATVNGFLMPFFLESLMNKILWLEK